MLSSLANSLKFPELRKKILFTLFVIFVFRILSLVPIPGVNLEAVKAVLVSNQLLGFFNYLSGGGLENFSIITLGLGPYISASIIMQLMTMIFPSLEALSKEGEAGRQQINQYTRLLTVPLCFVQSYSVYLYLKSSNDPTLEVIPNMQVLDIMIVILTMTAGTLLTMWIGEILTERGIGNGISMLIFVGIVSGLPSMVRQTLLTAESQGYTNLIIFGLLGLLVIASVVVVNEGTRNVPIEYAKRIKGSYQSNTNFLPLKINQAGVIPIIFASSLILLPSILGQYLIRIPNDVVFNFAQFINENFGLTSPLRNILYFLLVVGFTYFYTAVQFNPDKISDQIKKNGGFIPGIRPGKATSEYLNKVITRITLAGASFLGIIAVLPSLLQNFTSVTTLTIGGTSLLIVVSVVLETLKQIESLTQTKNYDAFID